MMADSVEAASRSLPEYTEESISNLVNRIIDGQVADVDAFDEETLWANLKEGGVEITGENLNIEKLDLQEGTLIVTGFLVGFDFR